MWLKTTLNIWIFDDWNFWSVEWSFKKWEISESWNMRIIKVHLNNDDKLLEELRKNSWTKEKVNEILQKILKENEWNIMIY